MNPISLSPTSVAPGGNLTICYVDSDAFPLPVTLTLTWTPAGLQPTSITLTASDPCETIQVPDAATSLLIADGRGNEASPKIT